MFHRMRADVVEIVRILHRYMDVVGGKRRAMSRKVSRDRRI